MTLPYEVYFTEKPVHDALWAGLHGDLAFDIGAHWGQSVQYTVVSGRFARVVSCEPAAETFAKLSERYSGDPRVTLLPVAVADRAGVIELAECAGAIAAGELVSPALAAVSPNPYYASLQGLRTVPCTTLDELAATYGVPDLVKIDTEGSEALILRGGESLIGRTRWLVELHSPALRDECLALLGDMEIIDYPFQGASPGGEEGRMGWLKSP
jgi:FkbM family methyltransferase